MKCNRSAVFGLVAAGLILAAACPLPRRGGLLAFARNSPASNGTTQPVPAGQRTPHVPLKEGEVRELTIKELGNFDYDPDVGGAVPEDVRRLNGAHLRLKGFMVPLEESETVSQFVLVPDLAGCCFGQAPGVQHMVIVRCAPGKMAKSAQDQVIVDGVLSVRETRQDGYIVSLFQMVCTSVKPAVAAHS